jgi:hypothetical protein
VDVVGHEGIGVDVAVPIGSRFFQPMEVEVVILLGEKTRLSIDSSLNNVLRHSGQFNAWATWHGCSKKNAKLTPMALSE